MNRPVFKPRHLLTAGLLISLTAGAGQTLAEARAGQGYEPLRIAGESPGSGLFDVSIEYGPEGTGWIAYSRVIFPKHVETHLARSTDHGRTWVYVGTANHSIDGTIPVKGKPLPGVWRYETPSLVYDPGDVAERRWKLLSQQYFTKPPYKKGDRLFTISQIVLQTAARPDGPWSKPVCLFGKLPGCVSDLNRLHPDLSRTVFYNEIGTLMYRGTLYVSIDTSTTASGLGDWRNRRIVLVASADSGRTWRYVGTLTNFNDASRLGYVTLTGSSLATEGGRQFLLVSPAGARKLFVKNRGHDGTLVFEFEDISRARLKRDGRGHLQVIKRLPITLHSGGLSDHDARNTSGGILFSQISLKTPPEVFRLFSTKQRITE